MSKSEIAVLVVVIAICLGSTVAMAIIYFNCVSRLEKKNKKFELWDDVPSVFSTNIVSAIEGHREPELCEKHKTLLEVLEERYTNYN